MLRIHRRFVPTSRLSICSISLAALSLSLRASAAPAIFESNSEPSRYANLGPWSLSAGFPQGGSTWGSPTLGIRNELFNGEFLSLGLNLASDKTEKSESQGVFAKWNHMLSAGWGKSFPYAFLQTGYVSQKLSETAKKDTSAVFAVGLGVEVSLLREISTSLETGLGGVLWPSSQLKYSTATTQLSVHYHFQF